MPNDGAPLATQGPRLSIMGPRAGGRPSRPTRRARSTHPERIQREQFRYRHSARGDGARLGAPAARRHPRPRRQVDLASRADDRRARGRRDRHPRAARGRGCAAHRRRDARDGRRDRQGARWHVAGARPRHRRPARTRRRARHGQRRHRDAPAHGRGREPPLHELLHRRRQSALAADGPSRQAARIDGRANRLPDGRTSAGRADVCRRP